LTELEAACHGAAVAELPGEPREHMDALLKLMIPTARRRLVENGEVVPFGASMALDGQLDTVGGVLDELYEGLRASAEAGNIVASAVCVDVQLSDHPFDDAIRVELEHRDAEPLTCLLPYRRADDALEYGELIAFPGEWRTFAQPD